MPLKAKVLPFLRGEDKSRGIVKAKVKLLSPVQLFAPHGL